eukprot:CAMPEP_0201495328 /NCGR_PEP_ID=MMETSP0151_2-20130828/53395_1 /ASSEMBLY_ACC=CAM_ASM_000257 /TAXON_ID=200890 /ORGANISM="Paramoeba atlantica, Strain 621/1 / CCAP 1560/9" /LENGTH=108 /DNA_ID=CAMNT_0047884253 /DNA_START=168 /DNA_END=490 /DNA_ORIENTATION=+
MVVKQLHVGKMGREGCLPAHRPLQGGGEGVRLKQASSPVDALDKFLRTTTNLVPRARRDVRTPARVRIGEVRDEMDEQVLLREAHPTDFGRSSTRWGWGAWVHTVKPT